MFNYVTKIFNLSTPYFYIFFDFFKTFHEICIIIFILINFFYYTSMHWKKKKMRPRLLSSSALNLWLLNSKYIDHQWPFCIVFLLGVWPAALHMAVIVLEYGHPFVKTAKPNSLASNTH